MLNTKNTVKKLLIKESKMDSSTKPQSLETLTSSLSPVPLKSTRDMSMWLRQVFPANHLALQESKKDKTMKETSGRKRFSVFATFDPDTHSWRTSPVSLILDTSAKSSLRWPKQGIMQDGLCWEQTMWEPGIEEKDSGSRLNRQSIPTPSAWDGMRGPAKQYDPKSKSQKDRNLNTFGRIYPKPGMWPTPTARDWKDNGKSPAELARNSVTLATHAGGQLNPTWVEWLMGWPEEWTDLKPLAMDKFRQWLNKHGKY